RPEFALGSVLTMDDKDVIDAGDTLVQFRYQAYSDAAKSAARGTWLDEIRMADSLAGLFSISEDPAPIDMSDTHFSLVEGTSSTLDLTQAAGGVLLGDPLPLTEHKLIDPDSAYVTLLASITEEDFNAQTGWLWEMVDGWLELTAVPAGGIEATEYISLDDYEWLDGIGSITLEFTPMPEPGTMLLLGFGALGILLKKKRRS
ncbi:unnamed protein product, partial [marine sediment metagenome]